MYKKAEEAEEVIKEWRKSRLEGIALSFEQFLKYVQQEQRFPHTPKTPEFVIHSNLVNSPKGEA